MVLEVSGRRRKIVVKENPSDIDGNEEEKVNDWGVTVELYNHQKTSVKRMEYIEENRVRNYTIENNSRSCVIDSNFGILNDKVGAGKTLTCISLISREINKENYKNEISNKEYVNIHSVSGGSLCLIKTSDIEKVKFIPITIVVVPNSIIFQWKSELKKSNLKFKIVSKIAEIEALNHYFKKVNVIVVTKTMYSQFGHNFNKLFDGKFCIKRLIFDEYCEKGSFTTIKSDFYWLVSGTIPRKSSFTSTELRYNLIKQCLECSALRDRYYNVNWSFVTIKNSEEEIATSFEVAKVENIIYHSSSKNQIYLNLDESMSLEVKRMIAADDIKGAIQAIGGNIETDSLLKVIMKKEENKIIELEASITYHSTLSQHDKVEECKRKLEAAKKKLQNMKEKIERDESDGECTLCCEEFIDRCLIECCKSIACGKCVTKIIKQNKNCPFCRAKLDIKNLIVSSKNYTPTEKKKKEKKPLKTKAEHIVDIIKKKPNGKFIIFSESSETYHIIESALKSTNLKYSEVKGTTQHKSNVLNKFRNGDLNIIFLNGRSDGSGINLPETTDIILYHKVGSKELETQLLGRALRLGRTNDLRVHRLLYEQEYNIEEDEEAINYLYQRTEVESSDDDSSDEDDEKTNEQIESDYQLALRLQNEN
jgi:superfamily II DNA or RNA helicase